MIDVAAGDKIPRKGGPGITKSDLLIINKIDLAPMVGASLEVMDRDAKKMRRERPFLFSNLKTGQGVEGIVSFVETAGMLLERARAPIGSAAERRTKKSGSASLSASVSLRCRLRTRIRAAG